MGVVKEQWAFHTLPRGRQVAPRCNSQARVCAVTPRFRWCPDVTAWPRSGCVLLQCNSQENGAAACCHNATARKTERLRAATMQQPGKRSGCVLPQCNSQENGAAACCHNATARKTERLRAATMQQLGHGARLCAVYASSWKSADSNSHLKVECAVCLASGALAAVFECLLREGGGGRQAA
eukprot:354526-Chlamydomonas_euryale.AAC.4